MVALLTDHDKHFVWSLQTLTRTGCFVRRGKVWDLFYLFVAFSTNSSDCKTKDLSMVVDP